jgi:uncharacterized protein YndB with AHSA1/START domain
VNTTLHLRRVLPAPRDEVFRAWTDPEQLRQWFTPLVGSLPGAEVDLRVGGAFRWTMQTARWRGRFFGTYLEVDPPERLVFTWEAKGFGFDVGESRVTVEFHDRGDETELVLTHERQPNRRVHAFHSFGWWGTLRRLDRLLRA